MILATLLCDVLSQRHLQQPGYFGKIKRQKKGPKDKKSPKSKKKRLKSQVYSLIHHNSLRPGLTSSKYCQ